MRGTPSTAAARGIAVLALGLLFGALLDAEGLRKQAETQPQGWGRRLAVDVATPLLDISRRLHLTSPRRELQDAIGRQGEDVINTRVELPPPAIVRPSYRTAPQRRSKPEQKPVFTAAHPLRVWVAGDSLAQVPGEGLERLAPRSVEVLPIESRLATGLSRPDLFNWFTRVRSAIAQERPRVAVLSFGADDAHNLMTGLPAERSVGPFGSPSWKAEYRRRVDGVTRELAAAGIYTVWLGLPIPAGPGFRQSFPVVNSIVQSVVKSHPTQSAYVNTWKLLRGSHGRYSAYLRVRGALTLMRLPDGVHYSAAGGDLIARTTLATLEHVFALRR